MDSKKPIRGSRLASQSSLLLQQPRYVSHCSRILLAGWLHQVRPGHFFALLPMCHSSARPNAGSTLTIDVSPFDKEAVINYAA